MRKNKINFNQFLILILVASLAMTTACKKESNDTIIPVFQNQRFIEMYELQDGTEHYKEIYKYEGEQLVGYDFLRIDEESEWRLFSRYTFEYPIDNVIIEKRFGASDTLGTPTREWHKKFSGDHLVEMIYYSSPEGILEKYIKYIWNYDQERLMETVSFRYENNDWLPKYKSVRSYQDDLCIRIESYDYEAGGWNIIYKSEISYSNGFAIEMNGYTYNVYSGVWRKDEQCMMEYIGAQITAMHFYDVYIDSLRWDYSVAVTYNESNNPATYTISNNGGPEEVLYLFYEEGKGNFIQATAGNSSYNIWPWFPSPVK